MALVALVHVACYDDGINDNLWEEGTRGSTCPDMQKQSVVSNHTFMSHYSYRCPDKTCETRETDFCI